MHSIGNFLDLGLKHGKILLSAFDIPEGGLGVLQLGPERAYLSLEHVAPELEAVLLLGELLQGGRSLSGHPRLHFG